MMRSWQKRKRLLEIKIFKVSKKKKKVKKMSRVQTSISKSSDEIQFLNDAIQVQILNNPENEMLLRNVYARRLEELHKAAVC